MKELLEIVKAHDDAQKRGLKTALATVVHVFGSAYRHEGARMLVAENGELTGAISGGCLEGDALRKARLAIIEGRNMLVTYDTTDEDDATLGVGLGCNGIIQVLLEPIASADIFNPINLFKIFLEKRQKAVLGTFFNLENKLSKQQGTCVLLTNSQDVNGNLESSLENQFLKEANLAVSEGRSFVREYPEFNLTGFIEFLKPSIHLLIVGAGNDAIPLAKLADVLGWDVTVIDGRSNYSTTARFPSAKQVMVSKPEGVLRGIAIDNWTVAVLMTHNYNYDIAVLPQLISANLKYIGALGPKKKLKRMLDDLEETGVDLSGNKLQTIFGPTGLDIGSETPEEIALSIVAEIKAVLSNNSGTSLKYKASSDTSDFSIINKQSKSKFGSCSIDL